MTHQFDGVEIELIVVKKGWLNARTYRVVATGPEEELERYREWYWKFMEQCDIHD